VASRTSDRPSALLDLFIVAMLVIDVLSCAASRRVTRRSASPSHARNRAAAAPT
jgi:hypothetical protein